MIRSAALALLLVASAAPALAAPPAAPPPGDPQQLRFLAELRVEPTKNGTRIGADLQKLDPGRFIKVGMEWVRDEKNRPRRPRFKLVDLAQRRFVELEIPLDQLPRTHTDVLGQSPPPELVHYDGEKSSMIFRESRNGKPFAKHFCQFDHRAGRFSDLVKLGDLGESRFLQPFGFDPQGEHFYFAMENWPEGKERKGPLSLDLARIGLKTLTVDWQLTLDLPKRKPQLGIKGGLFSHDGRRLVFIEHAELGDKPNPPQRAYLVDVERKTIDLLPVPVTAYGAVFSRDDRHLIFGSNQLAEITRVDLAKRQVDLKVKAISMIGGFALTPSGKSLLVFANTIVGANKVVEVRRVADLGLRTSIPVRLLFPGQDGVHPGFVSSEDGRLLVSPIPETSGFPAGNGVRIFEVPDDVDSPATAGTSPEELRRAQAVVAARRLAGPAKIQLHVDPAEEARTPAPSFSPIVVAPGGDVLFTGTWSANSDYDYKPGRTKPVVVRLDPSGRKRWEVTLAKPGFEEHTGARVAATADGGCVAQIYSYARAGGSPNTRLVKLDAKGKTLWELQFRGGGNLDTPLADRVELLPDGSISLAGRIYPEKNVERKWTALVSGAGKVLSDVTGE